MATIVKRDGNEVLVIPANSVRNLEIKRSALLVIADHADITNWEETHLGGGRILLKLECIVDKSKLHK